MNYYESVKNKPEKINSLIELYNNRSKRQPLVQLLVEQFVNDKDVCYCNQCHNWYHVKYYGHGGNWTFCSDNCEKENEKEAKDWEKTKRFMSKDWI